MRAWQRYGILTAALLAFGAARLPFEAALTRDLRGARLLPEEMDIGTREQIGQTSAAVALGGLRTLVATFLNLRAFGYFEEQRWDDVADTYDLIVDLAPHTEYYWDAGFSHSAYNAASYYINDSELSPHRRKQAWRDSILRGRAFLERGIRNNPDSWKLPAHLGLLLSDSNKFPAFRDPEKSFAEAADAYQKAAENPDALPYLKRNRFYALARIKGRETEALALARKLYQDRHNRTPTLLNLLLVLEARENPEMDTEARAIELFGSPLAAYKSLSFIWRNSNDRFPVYGVAATLQALEKTLDIPRDKSLLNQPLPPPRGPDQWFSK
jgi:hypothetical protein